MKLILIVTLLLTLYTTAVLVVFNSKTIHDLLLETFQHQTHHHPYPMQDQELKPWPPPSLVQLFSIFSIFTPTWYPHHPDQVLSEHTDS